MSTILDTIIQKKIQEEAHKWNIFDREKALYQHQLHTEYRIPSCLTIDTHRNAPLKLIAEIKQASPSQGIICEDFDPVNIARQYVTSKAHAISILTEKHYFKGSLEDLYSVRKEVSLPLLCKDFIVDCYQVYQAYIYGADIMLLIVAALDDSMLRMLFDYIRGFGMQSLIEVHTKQELERVFSVFSNEELIQAHALVGINNRNLHNFSVDLYTTESIAPYIPSNIAIVAESGIFSKQDAMFVKNAGAHAILVGQGILQHGSISTVIRELIS